MAIPRKNSTDAFALVDNELTMRKVKTARALGSCRSMRLLNVQSSQRNAHPKQIAKSSVVDFVETLINSLTISCISVQMKGETPESHSIETLPKVCTAP